MGILYFILGFLCGIILTIGCLIFSKITYNFLEKAEAKVSKNKGYIVNVLEENESIINNTTDKKIQ